MTLAVRRRVFGYIVAGALFIPSELYLLPLLDWNPACVRATNWAAANPGALPSTVAELVAFPEAYHRPMFSHLAPETRARMWQEHLKALLSSGGLNARQTVLVQQLSRELTPAVYRVPHGALLPAKIAALQGELFEVFTPHEYRRLFVHLGAFPKRTFGFHSLRLTVVEFLRGTFVASAQDDGALETPYCNCNADGWLECAFICAGHHGCNQLPWGCGFSGLLHCNSTCQ